MATDGLTRAALREILVGPRVVHPNVVQTYSTRCAKLTDDFFDFLEGPRPAPAAPDSGRRVLGPVPMVGRQSGDGFGDPAAASVGTGDPVPVFHDVLHQLEVSIGQTVTMVIMELCIAHTLLDAIRKDVFGHQGGRVSARVTARAVLRTATEVARGLQHLHNSGVLHADIKPANVLLQGSHTDVRGFVAKVADFGVAHLLPSGATSLDTRTWGSVAYMAPEALTGHVSRASDVWSFGVLLWEMVTRQRPYAGCQPGDIIRGVVAGSLVLAWPQPAALSPQQALLAGLLELGAEFMAREAGALPKFGVVVQRLVALEEEVRAVQQPGSPVGTGSK